jgi:hypothetical protein
MLGMLKGYKNLAVPEEVRDIIKEEAFVRRVSMAQLIRIWAAELTRKQGRRRTSRSG